MQQFMLNFIPHYQGLVYYPSNQFQQVFTVQQPYLYMSFNNSFSAYVIPNKEGQADEPNTLNNLKDKLQESSSILQNKVLTTQLSKIQNIKSKGKIFKGVQANKPYRRKQKTTFQGYQEIGHAFKQGKDRFIKKNTESNVINQVFSFLWNPKKSQQYLLKILKEDSKLQAFYRVMRNIKACCKSQLNRFYLQQLTKQKGLDKILYRLKKKGKKTDQIQQQQVAMSIRKLTFIYLRSVSRYSMMTSKKMNPGLWKLHFRKCDQILSFLFENS